MSGGPVSDAHLRSQVLCVTMGCGPGFLQGQAATLLDVAGHTADTVLVSDVLPYCQYLSLHSFLNACGTERRREDLLVWHMKWTENEMWVYPSLCMSLLVKVNMGRVSTRTHAHTHTHTHTPTYLPACVRVWMLPRAPASAIWKAPAKTKDGSGSGDGAHNLRWTKLFLKRQL